jgi:membrane protease subunit HflK
MPIHQGNGGSRGPAGSGGRPSVPDIDDLFRQGGEWAKRTGGRHEVIAVALLVVACLGVWTSYYTVPSDSVAVVQRFGKYIKEVPPGLHFKLPLGVDTAIVVPVKRQLKQEFGFSTPGAMDPFQASRDGKRETQMVTGDLNAALVEWVIQYRIADPVKFLFEVREPSETLRYVSESVMREVVGDRTVDEVLTIGRQEIESEALTKMQALNQAQQEKEKLINEARRDYNKVIPLAEGEKDQRIREADGYRLKRINEAEGDAARFSALFAEYSRAPEVTRRRIYIETLQDILPGLRSKVIVDEHASNVLPLLSLTTEQGDRP